MLRQILRQETKNDMRTLFERRNLTKLSNRMLKFREISWEWSCCWPKRQNSVIYNPTRPGLLAWHSEPVVSRHSDFDQNIWWTVGSQHTFLVRWSDCHVLLNNFLGMLLFIAGQENKKFWTEASLSNLLKEPKQGCILDENVETRLKPKA